MDIGFCEFVDLVNNKQRRRRFRDALDLLEEALEFGFALLQLLGIDLESEDGEELSERATTFVSVFSHGSPPLSSGAALPHRQSRREYRAPCTRQQSTIGY